MRYDAGGWGDYTDAVAGKIGAVLFAGCVAGVEGEGKNVETECCAKSVMMLRTQVLFGRDEVASSGAEEAERTVSRGATCSPVGHVK